MQMIEQRSDTELLTTAHLLQKSRIPQWKLEYLCKVEPNSILSLVARTIPPKSRLWLPDAPERLASPAAGHTR